MTQHVWDGMHLVLERNASGGVINRYERGMNGHLVRSTQHGFYLFNARGDVVHLTDASGAVIRTYRYDAFGNELNQNPNDTNPFRYAGEYWDFETNTIYLRARNFSPRLGRFTSPDSHWGIHNMQSSTNAIMQSANLYVFVMNNPIFWIDPLGLFAWNERDNQWISVDALTTRAAGGTFNERWHLTPGASFREATISIWDVEVTFRAGDENVSIGPSGTFMVRADTFYKTIVDAAGGEMVFLGGNNANIQLPGGSDFHMHIAIFAAHCADGTTAYNRLLEENPDNTRWGLRFGYISGTAGGFLRTRGQINGDTYMTRANRQFFHHLSSGPGTGTALFAGFDHFWNNHNNTFVYSGLWTNSTSYTIGLVNAVGLNHGLSSAQIERSRGINNAIAARHFGR